MEFDPARPVGPPGVRELRAVLPMSPGLNHTYSGRAGGGGLYASPAHKLWCLQAAQALSSWPRLPEPERWQAIVHLRLHCIWLRDIDSVTKAVHDELCRTLGINDREIIQAHQYKVRSPKKTQRIEVVVRLVPKKGKE